MPKRPRVDLGAPLWWHVDEAEWYESTLKHWTTAVSSESDDGVLGGFGSIDAVDVEGSLKFLAEWHGDGTVLPRPGTCALDCGAGIGRVSEGVLLKAFEKVRLVEVSANLLARAEEKLGASHAPGRCEFVAASLREYEPAAGSVDVAWVQWILGHLTDNDVLRLLQRCRTALRPGGAVIVKENNAVPSACEQRGIYTLDEPNANVIRSHGHHLTLFKLAGLKVVRFKVQEGFPDELHAVRMYLLVPAS